MTETIYQVALNDQVVGHIWGNGEHSIFSFHDAYLNAPNRPVLGQHFEDRLQKKARRHLGMHPWFENALPDVGGALRQHYTKALSIPVRDSMTLLGALGEDLPGAVRVFSDKAVPEQTEVVDEERFRGFSTARFSLGGVQLKFSMSGTPERLSLRLTADDGDAWILKIGSLSFPSLAENEHAIMSWCRAAGFDVPETHIVEMDALPDLGSTPEVPPEVPTGFLVKRYDRIGKNRIHQEDFAQVLNLEPDQKYTGTDAAGLLKTAIQLLGKEGAREGLARLIVVVATGNCDAHLKNWSLVYPDAISAKWSPLYDQVCTTSYPKLETKLGLRIGNAKHIHQVEKSHIRWVAKKAGLSQEDADSVLETTITRLIESYAEVAFLPDLDLQIRTLWTHVPLLAGFQLPPNHG